MGRRGPVSDTGLDKADLPPAPTPPDCPANFGETGKLAWRNVWADVAARFFTPSSWSAVERYCDTLDIIATLSRSGEDDLKLRKGLEASASKLETELGLTPMAKARLKMPLVPPQDPAGTSDDAEDEQLAE